MPKKEAVTREEMALEPFKKAKAVFAQIWEYLKVIQRVGGYQIYDPQMECIIDSESTLDRAAKCYERVSQRFRPSLVHTMK